jgi:hypothetical protein
MLRVLDPADAHPALAPFSWDLLSSATEERAVNRAQLIAAESHDLLLIGLGAMVRLGLAGNEIVCFSDWKRLRRFNSRMSELRIWP